MINLTMKKQFKNYLFVLLSFLSVGFLGSCTDDEATPSLKVELQDEAGYISEDAILAPGTAFKVKWIATKGAKDMESFNVTEGNNQIAGFPQSLSGGDRDKYTNEVSLNAPNVEGEYTFKFTVTDKDGLTSSQNLKITVAALNSYTTILLGNQKSTEPSFYATSTNTRYKLADAATNSAKVDFGYGNGSQAGNEFFLGAPTDASIQEIFPDTKNWATKNATKFVLTNLTAGQFDGITSPGDVISAVDAGTNPNQTSRVRGTEIEANDVVGFTTAAGKKGLIKVISRSTTASTTDPTQITIAVKVVK
jgi:hypothetical protein